MAGEEIVQKTARLYGLTVARQDLAWLMLQGIVDASQAKAIVQAWDDCVRVFDAEAMTWTEAFMIPPELVFAPIARDWVAYNKYDNQGQVLARSKY